MDTLPKCSLCGKLHPSDYDCNNPQQNQPFDRKECLKNARAARKPRKKGLNNLVSIDLEKVYKKLTNVLNRDTNHLLEISINKKLSRDDALSLVNYLKLLKNLKQMQNEDLEGLSDEELAKLADK